MRFVAVDTDNGEAKIVHAKNDEDARNIMVKHLLDEEIFDDEEEARDVINEEWDFYSVTGVVGKNA